MAKIDIPDPEKSKEAQEAAAKKWWKNPIIFASIASGLALLILAPMFALSIKNHNSLMTLVTSLNEDVTSLKEDVTFLKGDTTSLKGDITFLKGDITSLQGDMTFLKGNLTSLNEEMSSSKGDVGVKKMCPEGSHEISNICYFFVDHLMNFQQANNFCHEKGATIFEPRNKHINDNVYDLAKTMFMLRHKTIPIKGIKAGTVRTPGYWIGIVRSSGSDNWKWTKDSSVVSFFNWSKGQTPIKGRKFADQPNMDGDCVVVGYKRLGAKWWDTSCEKYAHAICEMSVPE